MSLRLTGSLRLFVLLIGVLTLSACVTAPGRTSMDDPWEKMNRGIYKFNDVVDRATLKPIAKGYRAVTPQWMRTGVRNFFGNLKTPLTIANQLLQGKPQLAAQDTCRLLLNTTVGIGGFLDVASKVELGAHDEDFGQTLAVWGVPSGPYLMLPVFGPSTVRDGFGRIPDYFGAPERQVQIPWETETAISMADTVQKRETLLTTEETLGNAYDRYGIIRDAWLQRREYLIFDGNLPIDPVLDDEVDMSDDSPEGTADDTATSSDAPSMQKDTMMPADKSAS